MINITGIYLYTKFKDEKTGYTGFIMEYNDNKILCQGKIQNLLPNTPLVLTGNFIKSKQPSTFIIKNNRLPIFIFDKYQLYTKDKKIELNYFRSLNIENFNIAKINKMEDYFSDSVLSVIAHCATANIFEGRCPDFLKPFAKKIYFKTKWMFKMQNLFFEIAEAGGNYADVHKLYNKYGMDALQSLNKNPYYIGHTCGLNFNTCEYLAAKAGISAIDKRRAIGILFYAMDYIENSGNTYATEKDLKKACEKIQKNSLIGKTPFSYIWAIGITQDYFFYNADDNTFQRKSLAIDERVLAENIIRLQNSTSDLNYKEERINNLEKKTKIKLSTSQFAATNVLNSTGVKIITGGPGSGKTTLTNLIIKYCETYLADYGIVLCAPTGCAAQNMTTKTGRMSETIHKTLGLKPYENTDELVVTEKRKERIYIIDEVSMMDLKIAKVLFSSIPNDSLVILIGDSDQLPSVDVGCILQDLIDAGIPTYRLEGSFRQAKGSAIIDNAYKIKNGDVNLKLDNQSFDVFSVSTIEEAIDLCMLFVGTGKDANNEDIQVLCPTYKYESGAKKLSNQLQKQIIDRKTYDTAGLFKEYDNTRFYINDKIIMTANNYNAGYFNGAPGVITDIDDNGILIQFNNDNMIYIERENFSDINLSYALTIHKSQGGEYSNVIILLTPKGQNLINRNLLYTAVTRAKKTVTIITVNENGLDLVSEAIKRIPERRKTKLVQLINNC